MSKKLQYNEKPSKHKNLGEDVKGAQRHSFNTYESDAERRVKQQVKQTNRGLKSLKAKHAELHENSTDSDDMIRNIVNYEFAVLCMKIKWSVMNWSGIQRLGKSSDVLLKIRTHIGKIDCSDTLELARRTYNSFLKKKRNALQYLSLSEIDQYFEKHEGNQFTEENGIKKTWAIKVNFKNSTAETLKSLVRAVQFGNSVPDSEREYCMHNLNDALTKLNKVIDFDFNEIAFSFGSRGSRGSIAHYENNCKLIQINRNWIGPLMHEIGHAIDHKLDLISSTIPNKIRKAYVERLKTLKFLDYNEQGYYQQHTEIFARLFEQYIKELCPGLNDFAQTTNNPKIMPKLDAGSKAWLNKILKPILKKNKRRAA